MGPLMVGRTTVLYSWLVICRGMHPSLIDPCDKATLLILVCVSVSGSYCCLVLLLLFGWFGLFVCLLVCLFLSGFVCFSCMFTLFYIDL